MCDTNSSYPMYMERKRKTQLIHQGNGMCFFEFFRDLKKREKTDKSKKGLKVTKLTATFLCWVDCLKKALFGSF